MSKLPARASRRRLGVLVGAVFSIVLGQSARATDEIHFYLVPLPMLASDNAAAGKAIDGWHQAMEWTLLVLIGIHVVAAMAHIFIYRDRIMQRMLPG
jgi:cytochrome b561